MTIFQLFNLALRNKAMYLKILPLEEITLDSLVEDSIIPDEYILEAELLPSQFLNKFIQDFPNKNLNLFIQLKKYKLIKKFIHNLLNDTVNEDLLKQFFGMNFSYLYPILKMKNLPKYERILFEIIIKKEYEELVDMINFFVLSKQNKKRCYFIPKIETKNAEYQLGDLVVYSLTDKSQYVIRYLGPYFNCYFTFKELIDLYQYNDYETNFCINDLDLSYQIIYHDLSAIRGTEIELYLDRGLAEKKLKIELN